LKLYKVIQGVGVDEQERKIIATSMEPDGINNPRLSTGSVRYKQ